MNLLDETIQALREHGKNENDVIYVESFPLTADWKSFKLNANFDYDNGYGVNKISLNLKIVGDTWWLERDEYDGSEWWEYKEHPNASELRVAHPHEIMKMIRG